MQPQSTTPPAPHHGVVTNLDELLALREQAAHLDFNARRLSHSLLAGRYVSHFRGRGMDYFETRPYVEGDDIRNIDWRVTARTGKPHSKVFIEERERPVLLVADFSPSLYFGTRGALKSVIAARLGALLAWHVIQRGDRIGGLLFGYDTELDVRPAAGNRSLLPMLQALSEATLQYRRSEGKNRLISAIEHAARVARPGSLVLLLSDFSALRDEAGRAAFRQPLYQLSAHSDVAAFFIFDPLERQLPGDRAIPLVRGRRRFVISPRNHSAREQLQQDFRDRRNWLEEQFGSLGQPVIPVATDQPLIDTLRHPGGGLQHA